MVELRLLCVSAALIQIPNGGSMFRLLFVIVFSLSLMSQWGAMAQEGEVENGVGEATPAEAAPTEAAPTEAAPVEAAPVEAAPAAEEGDEDELEVLREEVEELKEELEAMREEQDDFSNQVSDELARRTSVSGYATTFFRYDEDGMAHFRFVKVIIFLNGQITERLRFFAEIEFEDPAKIGGGQGLLKVEQSFIEFLAHEMLGIRGGIILVPLGRFNLFHEEWRYAFARRPLLNDRLIPSTYADVGGELFGMLHYGDDFLFTYSFTVTNGLTAKFVPNVSDKGFRSARPEFATDNNDAKSLAGRITFGFTEHVLLGLYSYWGYFEDKSEVHDTDYSVLFFGFDALLDFKPLITRLEGTGANLKTDNGVVKAEHITDPDLAAQGDLAVPVQMFGGVLELEYQFFFEGLKDTFFGDFDNPQFFLASRLGYVTYLYDVPHDGRDQLDEFMMTYSIGYRPVYRSAFRFEFSKGYGDFVLKDGWRMIASATIGY